MPKLPGSVIAISGAASGIGKGVALELAKREARLSLADSDGEGVRQVAKDIEDMGCECLASVVDVRKSADVDAWLERTIQKFEYLDGAVNCAGVLDKNSAWTPVSERTDEQWDFVIDINLSGTFRCLRAQLSRMREGGSVVNMTSVSGFSGLAGNSAYSASKHGLIGLTKSAAKEVAARKIRVNCVAPGCIDTPMLKAGSGKSSERLEAELASHTPLMRLGKVEEIAKAIAFLLGEDSAFVTGSVWNVDGGMTA